MAEFWLQVHQSMSDLQLEHVSCAVCDSMDSEPIAVGEDFEYRTSTDSFLAVQCNGCGLVYLDPRPTASEFDRIYPDNYHAFVFSEEEFGLVYKVRRRLEARRVLSACDDLAPDARILDVGCGDGFHLDLLREFGRPGWTLEGVDVDRRALTAVSARGFTTHFGTIEGLDLEPDSYDLVVLIQTIEHVADPRGAHRDPSLLRPGGRLLIVTDNTGSPDFSLARRRHWGGYHFPRHWNLFNRRAWSALRSRPASR